MACFRTLQACGKLREGMSDIRDNAWRLLIEKDRKAAR